MLDGRVAIVTGASRGIGAGIARSCGAEGAAVVVAARTTEPGTSPLPGTIGETAAQIRAAGGTAVPIAANLAQPADRERLVEQGARQLCPPDILVSHAALPCYPHVEDFGPRRYALMFEVQGQAAVPQATPGFPTLREKAAR